MPSLRSLAVAVALLAGLAGVAAAQPAPAADPPAPAAAAAPAAGDKPPPYASPMRAQCGAELRKDLNWQSDIDSYCDTRAHEKSAASIQRNERHVFIAYAVIWVLLAGLVGGMWLRQGKLNAEIKRLEAELRRIEADDQKGTS